eukprot:TRINITY_DN3332_c0_g1_i4.p1 TRINITY_DN3332_c0_g1~~TRINITY_DN3332_c0_g1_i4.p1  ORF type:complete len:695 (-),score=133.86 TRINITY_DN3332_c0_g1_i4:33-2117(-)
MSKILKQDLLELQKKFCSDDAVEITELDDETIEVAHGERVWTLSCIDYPSCTSVFSGEEQNEYTGNLVKIVSCLLEDGEMNDGYVNVGEDEVDQSDEEPRWKKEMVVDLANLETLFGKQSVIVTPMFTIEIVEVEILISPLDILAKTTCQAWGIDATTPIVVKVSLSDKLYLEAMSPPAIECYQRDKEGRRKAFRIGEQLKGLLNSFVRYHWNSNISSQKLMKPEDFRQKEEAKPVKRPTEKRIVETKQEAGFFDKWFNSVPDRITREVYEVDLEWLDTLTGMGFDRDRAFNSLTHVNSLEEALSLLTSNYEKSKAPAKGKVISETTLSSSGSHKKTSPNIESLFENPDKTDAERFQCSSEYGFLVMVAAYARKRLPSLNNYCVICDLPHVFTGSMLKPAVCSRELCCWGFQRLGVGAGAAGDIATEAEVVDLMVCMAVAASNNNRRNLIFDPFPHVMDPEDPKKVILDPAAPDYDLASQILKVMPSIEQISRAPDFVSLKDTMDKAHRYCWPLFQWIISSNRCHIVQIPVHKQIKSMCTPHQYLLLSDAPEKEENFKKLKEEHGSTFAFHGSPTENWHAIMRKGLICASGTKLQVNGAAYGKGIYLSPSASTSFGYCSMTVGGSFMKPTRSNNRFLNQSNFGCIAICEVITKDIQKNGDIWVSGKKKMKKKWKNQKKTFSDFRHQLFFFHHAR